MRIRGADFGHVMNASGARGFFGEGYWFHRPWMALGLDYDGSTLVAKTTTLAQRAGNMPLKDGTWAPKELMPRCIVVKPVKGVVLNSVGLSGPGARRILTTWRAMPKNRPAMLSFMSVHQDRRERIRELLKMGSMLRETVGPSPRLAVQVNLSCPNAGLDPGELVGEAMESVRAVAASGFPVLAKVNALFPPAAAAELCRAGECDGIVVSNTIPWGKMPDRIDWRGLFGTDESPLRDIGGGGLSGKPLLPIVADWIREARRAGLRKPVVGGGGILSAADADEMLDAGATAVEIGSVAILRPWRVGGIIRHVNNRCGNG